jgi:hypothetical protein
MTTRRRDDDLVRRITRKIIAQHYTFGNDPDRQSKDRYQWVGFVPSSERCSRMSTLILRWCIIIANSRNEITLKPTGCPVPPIALGPAPGSCSAGEVPSATKAECELGDGERNFLYTITLVLTSRNGQINHS